MNQVLTRPRINNWRDAADQLRAAQKKYSENFMWMTVYEQQENGRLLKVARDQLHGVIENGAAGELDAAIAGFKAAQADVKKARQREINSYDAGKLAAELQVVNARVDVALKSQDPVAGLTAIKNDAVNSGDRVKQRAAYEVLAGAIDRLPTTNSDIRLHVNRVSVGAARDLAALRDTEEYNRAVTQAESAFQDMIVAHRQLVGTAQLLGDLIGDGGPYKGVVGDAYKRLRDDGEGGLLIDGEKV